MTAHPPPVVTERKVSAEASQEPEPAFSEPAPNPAAA